MENSRYSEVFYLNCYKIKTLALLMYVSQSNRHSDVTDWVPGPSYLRLKKKIFIVMGLIKFQQILEVIYHISVSPTFFSYCFLRL
jgi:hypothetical protein